MKDQAKEIHKEAGAKILDSMGIEAGCSYEGVRDEVTMFRRTIMTFMNDVLLFTREEDIIMQHYTIVNDTLTHICNKLDDYADALKKLEQETVNN